jgi:ATP-dependent Clp protease protease subunit
MNHFWRWIKNEAGADRVLQLNGAIAEETWLGDEITPRAFKDELLSGAGDV